MASRDKTRVAIVGAGISGLACAQKLQAGGLDVAVFDKGKRAGGRLATVRIDAGSWDLGAQYVEAGQGRFAEKIDAWRKAGVLESWPSGPPGALVGVPGMAALVEAETAGLAVQYGARVDRIDRRGQQWSLAGAWLAEGPFAAMILALPAEQAAPLLALHDLDLAREAAAVRSQPCWTLMVSFAQPLTGVSDTLRPRGAIAWAARDSSKPGRPPGECWVVQADAAWSRRHLERDPAETAVLLYAEFAAAAKLDPLPSPLFLKAHRWRFALAQANHGSSLWNPALRLGACGDWCSTPHIAGAWESGTALAERVIESLAASADAPLLDLAK